MRRSASRPRKRERGVLYRRSAIALRLPILAAGDAWMVPAWAQATS